jgi:hypothetical protein
MPKISLQKKGINNPLPILDCPSDVDTHFINLTKYFKEINKVISGYFDKHMYKLQFYLDIYKIICEDSLNPEPVNTVETRDSIFNEHKKKLTSIDAQIENYITPRIKKLFNDELNKLFEFLDFEKLSCENTNKLQRKHYKKIIEEVINYFNDGEKPEMKATLVGLISKYQSIHCTTK